MRTRCVFVSLLLFAWAMGGNVTAANDPPVCDEKKEEAKKLLSEIVKVDGYQEIGVINSRVTVKTPAIERIVNSGPGALEILILAMKDKSISFDAFTRCYSAADQIIQKANPDLHVFWDGGCETKTVDGISRLFPDGQMDEESFRKKVIQDIEEKRSEIVKKRKK